MAKALLIGNLLHLVVCPLPGSWFLAKPSMCDIPHGVESHPTEAEHPAGLPRSVCVSHLGKDKEREGLINEVE